MASATFANKAVELKMTLFEIFEELGDPTSVWESAMGKRATSESFYLYERHEISFNFWESQVWIFDTPQDFVAFTYALDLFDYVYFEDWDELDETEDFTKLYDQLIANRNKAWTYEDCQRYVSAFGPTSLQPVQFGRVSDLLAFPTADFEKSKGFYRDLDSLEEAGLSEAEYKIMHKYSERSAFPPSVNTEGFLEFLSGWG